MQKSAINQKKKNTIIFKKLTIKQKIIIELSLPLVIGFIFESIR